MTKTHEMPFRTNENECNVTKNGVKKMSKPMMEKRRRARINMCLMQLKEMVIDSGKQIIQNSKSKLEKADILELTVKYLQNLHESRLREHNSTPDPSQVFTEFIAGFSECAKRVEQFVCQSPATDPIVVTSLSSHLNNCIEAMQTHEPSAFGVIRHTSQCCPPSPAPSTMSSASSSTSAQNPSLERDSFSPISSAGDDELPLNLSSHSRFGDNYPPHPHYVQGEDGVWRPW